MISEVGINFMLVAVYTHGPRIDDPLSMRYKGSDFFYHKNHQGSITEITDINGNIAKMYKYDAFGRKYFESGPPLVDEFAYTGRELHDRTGLMYYRNRFYNPQLGRFMTQDPIGIAGGTNLYTYVGNSPVNYIDPLGLQQILWPPGIGQTFEQSISDMSAMYETAHQVRSETWEAHPENSYARHYQASRRLTEEFGPNNARALGAGNELQGLYHDINNLGSRLQGDSPWGFSWKDFMANEDGIEKALMEKESECKAAR